jgi:hypothetical protein
LVVVLVVVHQKPVEQMEQEKVEMELHQVFQAPQ